MSDVIDDLELIAANARAQLAMITPRHSRYPHYYKVVCTAEAAISRIEYLERQLTFNPGDR
jgi:hypothetical protein